MMISRLLPLLMLLLLTASGGLLLFATVEAFQMPSPVAEAKVRDNGDQGDKKERKRERRTRKRASIADSRSLHSLPFSLPRALLSPPNSNPLIRAPCKEPRRVLQRTEKARFARSLAKRAKEKEETSTRKKRSLNPDLSLLSLFLEIKNSSGSPLRRQAHRVRGLRGPGAPRLGALLPAP